MLSSIAQVEPLPLVPATLITGHSKRKPSRSRNACTRSSVRSMVFGCRRSQCASQSCSVSNNGIGTESLQHAQRLRDGLPQLSSIDDHVHRALLHQEFGALETFGQLLAHRVRDDARAGKTDQRLWLG